MVSRRKLSPRAAALLNAFQVAAVEYGRQTSRHINPDNAELCKARYRLERYLSNCGVAAWAGVRVSKALTKAQRAQ